MATTNRKTHAGNMVELTDLPPRAGDDPATRRWRVVIGSRPPFVAEIEGRELESTPGGSVPIDRRWTEEEILIGVDRAIDYALVSERADSLDEQGDPLAVTHYDLYAANGKL